MTSEDNRAKEFTERLSQDPVLVALAATATGGPHGETNGRLFARRHLERELGAGPAGIGEWAYREAASQLRAEGHPAEAETLRQIADTSATLAASAAAWAGRYTARSVTATEREGLRLIEQNAVRLAELPDAASDGGGLGADGARYTPVVLTGSGGASDPAVIVTTHAGTAEVVTGFFAGGGFGPDEWLADRLAPPRAIPSTALPLNSSIGGPSCRTAREELALSWLLNGTDPGRDAGRLGEWSFTACTRAEIYLAWRDVRARGAADPTAADVRQALALRMLRAPGWAAAFTGWPFGHLALAYFDRITATPVSAFQGRAAIRDLAREDAEALRTARAGRPGRRPGRPAWHPSYGPRPAPLPLSRPEDPSLGSGPRL